MRLWTTLKHFANEVSHTTEQFLTSANEMKEDGGWYQLAPYGDFPHPQGLQRFQQTDAINLVNEFESPLNILSRVKGLPWYIGHPDHPAFKDRFKDTKAYGRIKQLEARGDGLWANVKWSEDGAKLVKDETFFGPSVNWRLRKTGDAWRPVALKSVGFTNEPNIPVQPMAANEEQTMKTLLDYIRELLGVDPETGEDVVRTKLTDMANAMKTAKTDKEAAVAKCAANEKEIETLKADKAALETTLANEKAEAVKLMEAEKALRTTAETNFANEKAAREKAETDLATTKAVATTAETNFANERKAHAKVLLDGAITAGKITQAERPQWEKDFANEFEAANERLGKASKKLNTESRAGSLGARGNEQKSSTQIVQEKVNEIMAANSKLTYDEAFSKAKGELGTLFATMTQPAGVAAVQK